MLRKPTFVFGSRFTGLAAAFGWLHEQWEQHAKAENVNKCLAIRFAFVAVHCVGEDFQSAVA